ncbi:MAG: hypothetical protein N2486_06580 [Caloramator sp.]|nr:hypothetical protein [Caloramator sp.]
MNKLFKKFWSIVLVMCILINPMFVSKAMAKESKRKPSVENPEVRGYSTPVTLGTRVEFIDLNLANMVVPQGEIYEVYDHSYYETYSYSITGYSVGPRCNDKFLLSVAKGQTKTITSDISVSGTVTYGGSVGAEIKKCINLSLQGNVSGTFSYTYSKSTLYSGPPEGSQYNCRNYYGAINYDQYSFTLKKYDVYKVYNGGIFVRYETYQAPNVQVTGVKNPINVTYSIDTIQ